MHPELLLSSQSSFLLSWNGCYSYCGSHALVMLWEQMERAASLSIYSPLGCVSLLFANIDGVPRWTEHPVPSLVAPRSRHPRVALKWMFYFGSLANKCAF